MQGVAKLAALHGQQPAMAPGMKGLRLRFAGKQTAHRHVSKDVWAIPIADIAGRAFLAQCCSLRVPCSTQTTMVLRIKEATSELSLVSLRVQVAFVHAKDKSESTERTTLQCTCTTWN